MFLNHLLWSDPLDRLKKHAQKQREALRYVLNDADEKATIARHQIALNQENLRQALADTEKANHIAEKIETILEELND
ncbi:hypothetical protein [Paracoccus sp. (in: a-proteobacteria)]|uniref:hypothetical protein n=1 Tax=Paracoccus sp. TaxID=267 RepID=UPI0026E0DA67|nr:hypothetical protein [Paracoccus sp. (in: a-proteobacteria)]MDO5647347.1 hypothetical protein [Paracoccus sp. (in: a-proteobacteria)]